MTDNNDQLIVPDPIEIYRRIDKWKLRPTLHLGGVTGAATFCFVLDDDGENSSSSAGSSTSNKSQAFCREIRHSLEDVSTPFCFTTDGYLDRSAFDVEKWSDLLDKLAPANDGDASSSSRQRQAAEQSLKRRKLPNDALVLLGTRAPFGRGSETVVDTSVRDALEIAAQDLPEQVFPQHSLPHLVSCKDLPTNRTGGGGVRRAKQPSNSNHPRIQTLQDLIQCAMAPVGKQWQFQLYKLHMYGPGGKFERHVDTLHAENHVATVVIVLPSKHTGGDLVIQSTNNNNKEENNQVFRWSTAAWSSHKTQVCVFYTDCSHKVEPVQSGHRIVLQYDVYETPILKEDDVYQRQSLNLEASVFNQNYRYNLVRSPADDDPKGTGQKLLKDSEEAVERFRKAVQGFLEEQEKSNQALMEENDDDDDDSKSHGVAVLLRHKYALPALKASILKGADRVLYDALLATKEPHHHSQISLHGLLFSVETDSEGIFQQVDAKETPLEYLLRGVEGAGDDCIVERIPLIVDSKCQASLEQLLAKPHQEWTGNEAESGAFAYYSACMVIRRATTTTTTTKSGESSM